LTRFANGIAGGWTDAERKHVGGCAYCCKISAMQSAFLHPKAVPPAVREGRARAAAALIAAAPAEIRDKLAAWIREQVDYLAVSVRIVAGTPLSLALSPETIPVPACTLDANEPSQIHEVGGPYGYTVQVTEDEVLLQFSEVRRWGKPPHVFLSGPTSALDSKHVPAEWDGESNSWIVRLGSPAADYVLVITPGF
jgi:hypothetical protein